MNIMDNDWWFWGLLFFVIILNIAIILGCSNNDQASEEVRRISDYYQGRYDNEERRNVQYYRQQQQQNPPLYQTIVSPTFQYQKPPAPREPPPEYEEEESGGASTADTSRQTAAYAHSATDHLDTGSLDSNSHVALGMIHENNTNSETISGNEQETDGDQDRTSSNHSTLGTHSASQEELAGRKKRKRLKDFRITPLLNQLRGLQRDAGCHGKQVVGQSLFARARSRNSNMGSSKTDVQKGGVSTTSSEECLVYEFRLEPAPPNTSLTTISTSSAAVVNNNSSYTPVVSNTSSTTSIVQTH